ncbi:YgeY family selenium metabolism-linked hydrolase [Desulfogranum mediterraneum]|uniref:YgeY family selenium metabolism-linked hydrolase n=1 Tax=Desulfogranum mediterraneum TaxID=160661 RepID=UPI00040C023A|nr:YgeY family selenium metabolism-linked hydrolase [Desulfogranum mediterraneum]
MFDKIVAHTKHYEQEIYDLASELIRTESLSGHEGEAAKIVADKMKQLKFDSVEVDEMGNVCGSVGNGPLFVCVDGHMDVVATGEESLWSRPPLSGEQDADNIYGRGATDMKSAIASMIYAGRILKDLNLTDRIRYMVCASVQEEPCEGLAWEYMIEERGMHPDFVILAEPSEDQISLAQRGRMELKVSVSGQTAHASAPHMGDNAIYKMARIISDLEALNARMEVKDSELGKGCLVVSEVHTKAPSRCSVADHCDISIDRRLTWGESADYAIDQIKNLPSVVEAGAEVEVHMFEEPSYTGKQCVKECIFPAWKLDKQHPVTHAAQKAYKGLFNKDAVLTTWPFSTNGVAIMGKNNIPVIGYGPGDLKSCHVPDEYVKKEQVLAAAMMYVALPIIYANNN